MLRGKFSKSSGYDLLTSQMRVRHHPVCVLRGARGPQVERLNWQKTSLISVCRNLLELR
jgi:hypothetical protein